MKAAERIKAPCPQCHAPVGRPCVDPLGEPMGRPHKVRGPGQLEAHKAQQADRINTSTRQSYGPLFAHLAEAEAVTAADLIERDRRAAAGRFDRPEPLGVLLLRSCNRFIETLYVSHLARELERLAPGVGGRLAAHALATYPRDYLRSMLRRLFTTTERKQIEPVRVEADSAVGWRLEYRTTWEPQAPLMSNEEFDRLYRAPDHVGGLGDTDDDPAGLFARTIGRL